MTCPHLGRVTDGIVSFYGYSYVVQEFPFPAFASGFIASTEKNLTRFAVLYLNY